VVALSHPQVPLPVRSGPTLLGSTRRGRRTLEGKDRHLRLRASWLPLMSLPPLADADPQRLCSLAGLASSRFIGWGGGAAADIPSRRRSCVGDLRLAGINGSMDDPDANDDEGEEVVSW